MRKRTTFDQLIADTEALEGRLSKPVGFNQSRLAFYHEVARNIARRIILPTKPGGSDAELWAKKVERTVDRVSTQLMLAPGGIMISISEAPDTSGRLDPKAVRPFQQQVTHAEVVSWIKAGQAGLPGGKRITAADESDIRRKGINDKASVVMRAYYSQKPVAAYSRLRRAVQTYLYGSKETHTPLVLDAVARAWHEYFSVRYHIDLSEHVAAEVRRF